MTDTILGYVLISLPFLATIWLACYALGYRQLLIMAAVGAASAGCIIIGIQFIVRGSS